MLVVKAMILKQVLLLFAFRNLWIKKAAHTNNHAEKLWEKINYSCYYNC